ncbi:hypothetical protein [Chryseolinea lacunae]|uniref:Uncharacterized protein n=1 Tax=Chryseolinea lacunae TaxID=2801331 RepID=A0ABS1L129_9BACT|nr:hypothetical protein [Chryseolinea lacunae]MBL0745232.1 hypothetical protein [Chryseolinea lacunae]
MKKFGFFLSLILVLLSGFNTLLDAHVDRDCDLASSELSQTLRISTEDAEWPRLIFDRAASDRERHVFKAHAEREAEEEERDEHESISPKKKKSDSSHYLIAISGSPAPDAFIRVHQEGLPFGKDLSFASLTKRYLVFQVFRI